MVAILDQAAVVVGHDIHIGDQFLIGNLRGRTHAFVVEIEAQTRVGQDHVFIGVEHVHLVELLGAFAAVFQHGTHCGVAVDVGVFALDVAVRRGHEGQILVYLHQGGVHLARPGAVCAVQYVSLGGLCVTLLDEHSFYHILYFFYGYSAADLVAFILRAAGTPCPQAP